MRSRKLAVAALLATLIVAAAFVVRRPGGGPLQVRCLHVIDSGAGSTIVTLQVVNRSSEVVYFAENQRIQFRFGKHWMESGKQLPELDGRYLLPAKPGSAFITVVPPDAEGCRVVLVYSLNAPKFRALEYLTAHGWYGQFPKLCGWIAERLPKKAGKRSITLEVTLPPHAGATEPGQRWGHNKAPAANPAMISFFHTGRQRRGVAEVRR